MSEFKIKKRTECNGLCPCCKGHEILDRTKGAEHPDEIPNDLD